MIRGFWNFLFLNDSKTESESENIINDDNDDNFSILSG